MQYVINSVSLRFCSPPAAFNPCQRQQADIWVLINSSRVTEEAVWQLFIV